MSEMRKLLEALNRIEEAKVREVTIKILEMMDEGMLDPRAVAEVALNYLSEDQVADMAFSNDLLPDENGLDEGHTSTSGSHTYQFGGGVTFVVFADDGEVTLSKGHGENMFFSKDEWKEFVETLCATRHTIVDMK